MAFARKVVLVAGVGPGLGTAVSCLLASEGASVMAVARSVRALDPLAAHARARGWTLRTRTADLQVAEDVDRAVRETIAELGPLDAVAILAGHWHGGETLLHRMSDEEWTAAIQRNLDPVYRVARATLPHLVERRAGSVVLVSAGRVVRWAGSVAYTIAKGGLADVVPRLAHDYRPFGVRVNAVLPGNMSPDLGSLDPPSADRPIPLTDTTATAAWEVARAIRYLLSDESRWVTGTLLTVDGGQDVGGAAPTPR